MHPAFPPSLIDFFVRGQQTSLPGYREIGVPADIKFALDAADQDAEANKILDCVDGDLHIVIAETRHLGAVLFAAGNTKVDGQIFPPMAIRTVFRRFVKELAKVGGTS